jgi:tRNA(fMet)-specific endonuclease VapC
MPLFVLDTDVLSLYFRGDRRLALRLRAMPTTPPTTTIVTVQEMLQGRLAQVRRARTGHWPSQRIRLAPAYR